MPNWLSSMQQTFEYYTVDPNTWKDVDKLTNVKSCTITRDLEVATLGSATIDVTESIGECYVRVYLITLQNGVTEKLPLGTFLVQTPASSFNGRVRDITMDAYTPLLELKEKQPPLGYSLMKDANIMDEAYRITRENVRAPVVKATSDAKITNQNGFVSDPSDTWITFTSDLIANAKFNFDLDELGRILFAPKQELASLQPVWTYDDGEQSILYHDISLNHDLYGIPNVVEVICSTGSSEYNKETYYYRAENRDKNSPVSIVNRGREIIHRVTDPGFIAAPTERQVELYAKQLLKELSSIEYTVSYRHGYCGTRLGDCVRLNYSRAGLTNVKAKIISQTIKCVPGCPVTEKAIFTTKLWG